MPETSKTTVCIRTQVAGYKAAVGQLKTSITAFFHRVELADVLQILMSANPVASSIVSAALSLGFDSALLFRLSQTFRSIPVAIESRTEFASRPAESVVARF
jgi:hypothetical protein